MKRKITIIFMVAISFLVSSAYADGYEALVFKYASGESYSVATKNLEIYFKDGNLSFNNDNSIIPVASLASMEFDGNSQSSTVIVEMQTDNISPITIYAIDGMKKGVFMSISEAYSNLQPGIYIARQNNGTTLKINVKK